MTDIDIFKHTARTTLPAPVYQQLLPHLDTLLTTYETNNAAKEGDLYPITRNKGQRRLT